MLSTNMAVFPNPFAENITIEIDINSDVDKVVLKLTNLLGQTVWQSDPTEIFASKQAYFDV